MASLLEKVGVPKPKDLEKFDFNSLFVDPHNEIVTDATIKLAEYANQGIFTTPVPTDNEVVRDGGQKQKEDFEG